MNTRDILEPFQVVINLADRIKDAFLDEPGGIEAKWEAASWIENIARQYPMASTTIFLITLLAAAHFFANQVFPRR